MCLITTQTEPLIAEEDIITYKILRHNLQSQFYNKFNPFTYTFNTLNETEIKESDDWSPFSQADDEWISNHIQLFSDSIFLFRRECEKSDLKCFGQGFHSALDLGAIDEALKASWIERDCSVFECTIPKGSEYYVNPINLVVSNKLIIIKKID